MAFLGHGQAHMVGQLSTGASAHLHLSGLRSTVHARSHTCSLPHASAGESADIMPFSCCGATKHLCCFCRQLASLDDNVVVCVGACCETHHNSLGQAGGTMPGAPVDNYCMMQVCLLAT